MSDIMFLPQPTASEPERCPKCHAVESKQETCAHCGYVYPDDGETVTAVVVRSCAGAPGSRGCC